MKLFSILSAGIILQASSLAWAKTEVVCDKAINGANSFANFRLSFMADEKVINTRIEELEALGKSVTITHLSTTSAIAGATNKEYWGFPVVDKTCVVLKY